MSIENAVEILKDHLVAEVKKSLAYLASAEDRSKDLNSFCARLSNGTTVLRQNVGRLEALEYCGPYTFEDPSPEDLERAALEITTQTLALKDPEYVAILCLLARVLRGEVLA